MSARLWIAVFGAGRMGRVHLSACELAGGVELTASPDLVP